MAAIQFEGLTLPEIDGQENGAESLWKLTAAQEKLIETAKEAIHSLEAEEAALTGFRSELLRLKEAADDNSILEYWESLTDAMQSGLLKAYPELAKIIVAMEDGEFATEEYTEAMRIFNEALIKANETAKQTSFDQYKDAGGVISSINDALEKLGDKKQAKLFGIADLDSLVDKYPELLMMLGNQAQLEEYLIALKGEQAKAQSEAYANMLMNSESYFSYMASSNNELYQLLTDLYGADVKNFKTLADAKAEIENQLINGLGKAWQKHFSTLGEAFAALSAKASDAQKRMDAQAAARPSERGGIGGPKGITKDDISAIDAASALSGFENLISALDGFSQIASNIKFEAPNISAGSSGGSSGKSEAEKMLDEISRMLDLMEQLTAIRNFDREMNQLNQTYYKNRGEISNYISAMQDELAILEKNTAAEQENVRVLEQQMAAKKAEIASLQYGTEEFDKANEALASLQDAHQKYSKSLLQNKIDVDALTEAIKEQERQIRQMHIDVQNLVENAIRDREALYESMLKAEISMENEILAILKKRYETERDLILDNINERIKALRAEKAAIDENLRKRKEEQDWADKQKRLNELQAQLARVMADPTRQREAAELRLQIDALRNEMAWDTAEQEAKAQKDSIDQQISSLEDYIEYVKKHYEELFKYPETLIAEMRQIMQQTDDQIIAWLKANSEDYAASSARTQESMVRGWQNTLNEMRGHIVTYWSEVESIIAQGDEAIIAFLKEHSADYRAAGALQAEAYVDEWQRKLDALKAAARQTYEAIQSYSYSTTQTGTSSGSSGSGGSSGGSSGGGSTMYQYGYRNNRGTWVVTNASSNQQTAFQNALNAAIAHWNLYKGQYGVSEVLKILSNATIGNPGSYIRKYAKGGLADYTGLAWLDGTPSAPEAILDPNQTKIFASMVKAMEKMAYVKVPSFGQTVPSVSPGDMSNITFGDIIIQVDKLDSDRDLNELAKKIEDRIASDMRKGRAVGGLFFGRGR